MKAKRKGIYKNHFNRVFCHIWWCFQLLTSEGESLHLSCHYLILALKRNPFKLFGWCPDGIRSFGWGPLWALIVLSTDYEKQHSQIIDEKAEPQWVSVIEQRFKPTPLDTVHSISATSNDGLQEVRPRSALPCADRHCFSSLSLSLNLNIKLRYSNETSVSSPESWRPPQNHQLEVILKDR